MAEGLRKKSSPLVSRIAGSIAKVLPYPNLFSYLGLALGIFAALILALRLYTLGGIVLLLSGAMDVLLLGPQTRFQLVELSLIRTLIGLLRCSFILE